MFRGYGSQGGRLVAAQAVPPMLQAIKIEVNHRGGVKVNIWLTTKPPMMAIPSGRRNSDPVPVPTASGNAPSMAAMVVIRMGRKRNMHASIDGIARVLPFIALCRQSEIHHHNGILLDDSDQQNDSDDRDYGEFRMCDHQRQQRANAGGGQVERIVTGWI